jgi:gamma-glutamyltranspeptidase / glutathione hydrolase
MADRIEGRAFATRSEVWARNGAVATSHPLATGVALELLRRGGSAVDAAIGANAALALMEPTGAGLGGDLFALIWSARERRLHGLNASGRSPFGLSLEELRRRGPEIPAAGPLPVSVPGCMDGWSELHARFGRLSLAEILAPTIEYARAGVPVPQYIAWCWARGGRRLASQPNFAGTFLPGGRAPREGEVFRNPDLANTLEQIATGGRDAFYRGALAERMDAFCRRVGCALRLRDLEEHRSTWETPLSTRYRGAEVWELPPNGQGLAVLQMLNLLEGFDLRSAGFGSAAELHLLIEAKKLVFEDRARFYADPAFTRVPVEELLSREYAAARRNLIDPARAAAGLRAGEPKLRQGDTVYLATADRDRNMVSLIQSNYIGFGSGLVPDGLGFVLQNRGTLFALTEGHANLYAPHKRPFHTIIPGFATLDGRAWLAFGVMGGDMQPQGHVQVLRNLLDHGMNLQEAGDAPRFCHSGSSTPTGVAAQGDGGEVALESGFAPETLRELSQMGHRLLFSPEEYGGYQAIGYDAANDVFRAASESRKDGMAAGH